MTRIWQLYCCDTRQIKVIQVVLDYLSLFKVVYFNAILHKAEIGIYIDLSTLQQTLVSTVNARVFKLCNIIGRRRAAKRRQHVAAGENFFRHLLQSKLNYTQMCTTIV